MRNFFYTLIIFLFAACAPKAPTDTEVKDWYRELYTGWAEAGDAVAKKQFFEEMTRKAEVSFQVGAITALQMEDIFRAGDFDLLNNIKVWLAPAWAQQSQLKNIKGAEAAYAAWKYFPVETKKNNLTAFQNLLDHPALGELLEGNKQVWADLFEGTYPYKGVELEDNGILEKLLVLMDQPMPQEAVEASITFFETVFRDERVPPELKERIREKVLKQYITLLNSGTVTGKRKVAELESRKNYLEGPFAKGELIGYQAPDLDFIWWSKGNEKSLQELKGKVLMLDFWGTKCAPCIALFPEMRKLVEHYKGYPVEVIGIVSLQGYHVDVKNNQTIRTNGKPELEMELMKTFMKDMGMTWRVAFTRQPVFNPDYGVGSIPHVVLIDPAGVVRYNGIDSAEAPEKMDELLKEAGLPCPDKLK